MLLLLIHTFSVLSLQLKKLRESAALCAQRTHATSFLLLSFIICADEATFSEIGDQSHLLYYFCLRCCLCIPHIHARCTNSSLVGLKKERHTFIALFINVMELFNSRLIRAADLCVLLKERSNSVLENAGIFVNFRPLKIQTTNI